MTVPDDRRLRFDMALPDTIRSGQVEVMVIINEPPSRKAAAEETGTFEKSPIRWWRGCCKGLVKPGSVDRFLAECHAGKDEASAQEKAANEWLCGCCEGSSGTVDKFLERRRSDKERELAIEHREAEERKRVKISS